ncbi:hypothetical protein GCM10010168_43890 [Actinoplanes ianthinogenes]|uniref:Uncharacterized protein n=1 Tax=Actinoplanes ianthinogenes TaxID=122358 RepID=A0ABM7LVI4_9ACTN|nr:hypothetical protein Aiant_39590 [Actinoplanes ianthinogenes]GGR21061.1 hypothetical protein GCM10010168_43890 [Actinoplanes ianthinogenes]
MAAFVLEKKLEIGPGAASSPSSICSAATVSGAAAGRAGLTGAGAAGRAVFNGTEAFPYAEESLAGWGVGWGGCGALGG